MNEFFQTTSGNISFRQLLPVGSTVNVLVDYQPVREDQIQVRRGEAVTIVSVDQDRGYKVKKSNSSEASQSVGWIPHYVLNLLSGANPQKKSSWTFKFRKPSFSKKEKDYVSTRSVTVTVTEGETAVLKCAKAADGIDCVRWKKFPEGNPLSSSNKYSFENESHLGYAILYISNCDRDDAGDYQCIQMAQSVCHITTLLLIVKGNKDKTCVSSMIHTARPTCSDHYSHLKFVFRDFEKFGRADGQTPRAKIVITSGRGWVGLVNQFTLTHTKDSLKHYLMVFRGVHVNKRNVTMNSYS